MVAGINAATCRAKTEIQLTDDLNEGMVKKYQRYLTNALSAHVTQQSILA